MSSLVSQFPAPRKKRGSHSASQGRHGLGEPLREEGTAHSQWLAVGVTILIALFLCLPSLWAVGGLGRGERGGGGGSGAASLCDSSLQPQWPARAWH